MKRVGACLVAVALALGGDARAETPPSVWDRAKDPAAESSYALHLETLRALHDIEEQAIMQRRLAHFRLPAQVDGDVVQTNLHHLLERLERYHAETSPDVRLRVDVARVLDRLIPYEVDRAAIYRRSAALLRTVIKDAPDSFAAEESWHLLSQDCGHLGDHACERQSYDEILKRATEDVERVLPMLNLSETEMHLGHLKEAIDGYRETIRLSGRTSGDADTPALATWGLAIAYDRSGDHVSADREAKLAVEREQSIPRQVPLLHSINVYFYPEYEVHWYDGLRDLALAHMMKELPDQVEMLVSAEKEFATYVRDAEPAKDRWLEIAKARLAALKTERAAAEKRKAKLPPKKPAADDEDSASPVTF